MNRVAFVMVIGVFALFTGFRIVDASDRPRLFSFIGAPKQVFDNNRTSLASVREANVGFDSSLIGNLAQTSEISIPLFDGVVHVATKQTSEVRAIDDITWRGKFLKGNFGGDVVLTFRKGFVAGSDLCSGCCLRDHA